LNRALTTAAKPWPAPERGTRDPERTKERILRAAFSEFASKGFAGARVDRIARHASINKRMLYHYFGDKEALFREVLRRKMEQRRAWGIATPDDPRESLPYWFDLAWQDKDWIRLLEWEALHFGDGPLIDQAKRRRAIRDAVKRVARRQRLGYLPGEFDARRLLLAMVALTWFPVAFPQLAKLITGRAAPDERFIKEQQDFLRQFAARLHPNGKRRTSAVEIRFNPRANGCVKK
jgi:TetR/AcrR family transcriptional regulator